MELKLKPKALIAAFEDLGASANNLAYRRGLGFVEPTIKSDRATSPNLYSPYHSLKYGLGLMFERMGIDTPNAFGLAGELLDHWFNTAIEDIPLWIVEITNDNGGSLKALYKSTKNGLPPELNPSDFKKLIPWPGEEIWMKNADFLSLAEQLQTLAKATYYSVRGMMRDCIDRLSVPDEDIADLRRYSRMKCHIRDFGTRNIENYDFG